jgi:hypothetical protein
MEPILALIAMLGAPATIGDRLMPMGGPQAVIDKTVLPPKIPDCRTDAQIQRALAEKARGLPQSCDPPKPRQRAVSEPPHG